MDKREYLNNLLALCTEPQKDLFTRMYGDGPNAAQISHAIFQVENTLKNLNDSDEALKEYIKKSKITESELNQSINILRSELKEAHEEIKKYADLFEKAENTIDTSNIKVQERLELLNALEAGGVDNWEWYGESIENYKP